MTDNTNRDELVRMAGEQALLKRDNDALTAAQHRDQLGAAQSGQ